MEVKCFIEQRVACSADVEFERRLLLSAQASSHSFMNPAKLSPQRGESFVESARRLRDPATLMLVAPLVGPRVLKKHLAFIRVEPVTGRKVFGFVDTEDASIHLVAPVAVQAPRAARFVFFRYDAERAIA